VDNGNGQKLALTVPYPNSSGTVNAKFINPQYAFVNYPNATQWLYIASEP
jgi:hypothetical protein